MSTISDRRASTKKARAKGKEEQDLQDVIDRLRKLSGVDEG